jgi:large subunit ribosomal protein L1
MGKKYNAVKALVDKTKFYSITDAIELVKKTSITKFDSSIELSLKLNLDTTKAEQQLRGTISLPYYFGKSVKVLVIDDTMTPEKAKACGADFFGAMEKIAEIKSG